MAGMTVSGLVNGIDVPTIVTQLMASESIPQQMLQSQQATVNIQGSAYRAINTKFQSLLSAAQAMTNTSSTWTATTASSSSSSVAVTSPGTAQTGSLTFAVTGTAAAKSVITQHTPPYAASTDVFGSSIEVTDGTGTVDKGTITIGGSGTLADAVTAINNSSFGLKAAIVQVGSGQYQLQVTSATTGTASDFSLGSQFATVTDAADATLKVGTGAGAYTVTSSTNTFTGLMPGVTLTVSQPESPVTVDVASDPQAVGDKMKALIDAANAAIQEIASDTDTGTGSNSSGSAGPLSGDYTMQNLAQQVRNIVSSAVGNLGSPAQIGIELANPLDPTTGDAGTIQFDEDTFVNALKSNPSMVQSMVSKGTPADPTTTPPTPAGTGIAAALATLATGATDAVTGTLTTLANSEDTQSKALQSQIDDWTTRLADIQTQLTNTYTNMQTMLSSLQNQQSWLSSMFDSLTSSSSSSSSSSS